jgi:hypothetical protein
MHLWLVGDILPILGLQLLSVLVSIFGRFDIAVSKRNVSLSLLT